MNRLYFSPRSRQDLVSVHQWISEGSRQRAVRFVDKLIRKCEKLAENPNIGLTIEEAPDLGIRWTRVGSFLIFFRVLEDSVEIVRVIHGARDWLQLIAGDLDMETTD